MFETNEYDCEVLDSYDESANFTNKDIKSVKIYTKKTNPELSLEKKIILVKRKNHPYAIFQIVAQNNGAISITDEIIWKRYLIVGFSDFIYFIDLEKLTEKTIKLDSYFCRLYSFESFVLVSSGTNLLKLDDNANILWDTKNLGVDGIMVAEVKNNIIYGEAEWDPPGGWQLFEVDLISGKILVGDYYKYL